MRRHRIDVVKQATQSSLSQSLASTRSTSLGLGETYRFTVFWMWQSLVLSYLLRGSFLETTTSNAIQVIGLLPNGARIIAESGYTGRGDAERFFSVARSFDTPRVRELKNRARSRQESINKRIKDYHCFKTTWTDGIEHHGIAFTACCVLVQYAIEDRSDTGEPL